MSTSHTTSPGRKTDNRWLLTTVIVLVSVAAAGVIVAKRIWVRNNIHPVIQRKLDLMSERWKAQGISVGEPKVLQGIAGVEQAVEIDANGKSITLIEFDPENETQAKELKHIHEEHKSKLLGAEKAAEDDGSIVIIGFEEHPSKDKVLEAFGKK